MIVILHLADSSRLCDIEWLSGPGVWRLSGTPGPQWSALSLPTSGTLIYDAADRSFLLGASAAAKPVLRLSHIGADPTQSMAGTGTVLGSPDPNDPVRFTWSRSKPSPLSALRRQLLKSIEDGTYRVGDAVGVTTEDRQWGTYIHKTKSEVLSAINGSGHTSCYLVNGGIAIGLEKQKPPPQHSDYMTAQALELNLINKHIPGAYIEAAPGRRPRPGDFYSCYSATHKNQKYGHVGIVLALENGMLRTFDGGQEQRREETDANGKKRRVADKAVALIKSGRTYESVRVNGWVDLDRYFYGTPFGYTATP